MSVYFRKMVGRGKRKEKRKEGNRGREKSVPAELKKKKVDFTPLSPVLNIRFVSFCRVVLFVLFLLRV